MPDLITPDLVRLDADFGDSKEAVIRALAGLTADAGRCSNPESLAADALAREATSPTGLPGGIAIPHCRSRHIDEPTIAFARLHSAAHFDAKYGPADLVFLIATPHEGDPSHLALLTQLARALVKREFTSRLREAATRERVVETVGEVVQNTTS